MILMDCKAQGALEYLLLIAGVVLVAAIVIIILTGTVATPEHAQNKYHTEYNSLSHVV